jgi:hypothetical protein
MTTAMYPESSGGVKSRYINGVLTFFNRLGSVIYSIDPSNRKVSFPQGSILDMGNPTGAQDYYVDLNVVSSGDGKDPSTAFGTMAEAITASNLSIGLSANRWWARRNRIFVMGDGITENLTVLPEKCDIIGMGSDLYPFPRVIGHHTFAVAKAGVRFINMGFLQDSDADMLVFPASTHGLQLVGCHLFPYNGVGTKKGIKVTSSVGVKLLGNRIYCSQADMTKIFAQGISIEGVYFAECEIDGNNITAAVGVLVANTVTAAGGVIKDNVIRATGLGIDDDSQTFQVVNNRWMTDINTGTSTAGYDFNLQLAAGNIQMGVTGLCDTVPFTKIAE